MLLGIELRFYTLNFESSNSSYYFRDKIVQKPPTKFYEDYYTCKPNALITLQTAAGVASGNSSLALPFVVFLLMPFIYLILRQLRQLPPPEEYSAEDKANAADVLHTIMLRLRDGKRKGVKKGGLLENLYEELRDASYASFQDDGDKVEEKRDLNINYSNGDKDGRHIIVNTSPCAIELSDMA
jgi:hypothetical protein